MTLLCLLGLESGNIWESDTLDIMDIRGYHGYPWISWISMATFDMLDINMVDIQMDIQIIQMDIQNGYPCWISMSIMDIQHGYPFGYIGCGYGGYPKGYPKYISI